ncbi:MAG: ATP-binding cassette domain-containing protein [Anaerolineae bacterium]
MPILETVNLTKRFGELIAVDGLNLSVEPGEVFGLVGPNGAGKSTVIKMLTTLLPPTSGRAAVGGYDVVKDAMKVRHIIGYVPQMLSADGTLSGYENLLVFAKLYDIPGKEREKRVRDSLAFMGLSDAADRLVRTYSGGMIRRLEIAQSMLHRPEVLFLDEPTVGLDPIARQAVWGHIQDVRETYHTTILLTTHYMEEADSLCHRIAIMHHGHLVALGTPSDLKASVGGPETTLDDVFAAYTGDKIEETGGSYRETSRTRRTARRLG